MTAKKTSSKKPITMPKPSVVNAPVKKTVKIGNVEVSKQFSLNMYALGIISRDETRRAFGLGPYDTVENLVPNVPKNNAWPNKPKAKAKATDENDSAYEAVAATPDVPNNDVSEDEGTILTK